MHENESDGVIRASQSISSRLCKVLRRGRDMEIRNYKMWGRGLSYTGVLVCNWAAIAVGESCWQWHGMAWHGMNEVEFLDEKSICSNP